MRIASRRVVLPKEGRDLEIAPAMLSWSASTLDAVERIEGPYPDFLRTAQNDGPVEDLGERLVTPAFVDAHTHLGLTFLRGVNLGDTTSRNMVEELYYKYESRLTADDVRAFTRLAAYECLLSGTGLVWDHYYYGTAVAEGLVDAGLCGVVSPTLQDKAGPGADRWEQELQATFDIDDNPEFRKAGVFAALGPHASDTVSDPLWGEVVQVSRQRRLPIHAHLAQSLEEFERSVDEYGVSPVQRLRGLGVIAPDIRAQWVHMHYASASDVAAVAEAGQHLVICPHSALIFGFPSRTQFWHREKTTWSVGTDCAPTNDALSVQQELRLLAGQGTSGTAYRPAYERFFNQPTPASAQRVWQDREALRNEVWASSPALLQRVWAIPGGFAPHVKAGVLEPGALANVLVWDHEHPAFWPDRMPLRTLAYGAPSGAIWGMWSAGKMIGEMGNYHRAILGSMQYAEARREAEKRLRALSAAYAPGPT